MSFKELHCWELTCNKCSTTTIIFASDLTLARAENERVQGWEYNKDLGTDLCPSCCMAWHAPNDVQYFSEPYTGIHMVHDLWKKAADDLSEYDRRALRMLRNED